MCVYVVLATAGFHSGPRALPESACLSDLWHGCETKVLVQDSYPLGLPERFGGGSNDAVLRRAFRDGAAQVGWVSCSSPHLPS